MKRTLVLVPAVVLCSLPLAPAQSQAAAPAAREPVAVKASLELTWAALDKVVRGDRVNDRLTVIQESGGYRKGQWMLRIPTEDFRAASWAACQTSNEPPASPGGGLAIAEVRGDTASATMTVTVTWSPLIVEATQRPMHCRSLGEYEKSVENNVRKNAERAARH